MADTTAEERTPYLEARREWDDRYGALATSVRNWQLTFGVTAVCGLVLVTGFVLRSFEHEVGWEAMQEIALVVPPTRAERQRNPLRLWMATLPWAPRSRR